MKSKKIKPILAIMLAASLVACNQADTKNANNDNKTKQEQSIENKNSSKTKENTENKTEQDSTDKDDEELKEIIEKQYEQIKNTPSEMEIDGVKSKVSLNEDEFVKNFELKEKEDNEETNVEAYQPSKKYVTKNGGTIDIFIAESPYFHSGDEEEGISKNQISSILFSDDVDIKLPADISNKDELKSAKEKANSIVEVNPEEINADATTLVTNNLMFNLFYDDNKLSEIAFGEVDEYSIKQLLIMEHYKNSYEEDESASFKIGATDLKLPIKIQDLEKKVNGKAEDATKENIKEFYPDDMDSDMLYIENQKVIKTNDGQILANYISEDDFLGDWQNDEEIKELIGDVNFIQFSSNTPFELSNDKISINNKNIKNIKKVLEDAEIDYEDNSDEDYTCIEFFLDDNHFIRIENDMIRINKSDKTSRDMSRSSQKLLKDMEENEYVKEIFGGSLKDQEIEEIQELEGDKNSRKKKKDSEDIEEIEEIDNNWLRKAGIQNLLFCCIQVLKMV